MATGLSYQQHNEIIFQLLAILEDGTLSTESRLEQAITYCHGSGIFWPQEALEALVAQFPNGFPPEGA